MSLRRFMLVPGMLCLLALWSGHASAGEKAARAEVKAEKPAAKPQVEVVFCLDTTGSMSGLIDVAKKKAAVAKARPTTGQTAAFTYKDTVSRGLLEVLDFDTFPSDVQEQQALPDRRRYPGQRRRVPGLRPALDHHERDVVRT